MDAIQLIKRDHREVERLFSAFERAHRDGDRAEQRRLVHEIVRALSVHAAIEEQYLYPALRSAGVGDAVLEALEEHHAVKLTLREVERRGPGADRFAAKVRVLAEHVREHVEEEETELLPRLERALDAGELRELADALAAARVAAPTRPHPYAPDTPPGVFVAGGAAALVDRARDALWGVVDALRSLASRGAERSARAGRSAAERARREGEEALREARDRGEAVFRDVRGRGEEAVREVASLSREAFEGAREQGRRAADRIERQGASAARTVRGRAKATARAAGGAKVSKRRRAKP
jgi:hemerythrin superfamily protein